MTATARIVGTNPLGEQLLRLSLARGSTSGNDLEGERRYAVAEVGQLQVLEYDVGQVAIGGPRQWRFGGSDQRIRCLITRATVEPDSASAFHVPGRPPEEVAVGPDAAYLPQFPARERHGK